MPKLPTNKSISSNLQISYVKLRTQHELIVSLGGKSLEFTDIDDLLENICIAAALGMDTQFANVLIPIPDKTLFIFANGVGWKPSDIGIATVAGAEGSPAGYAFITNRPVISNNFAEETRFQIPTLFKDYGIERAISVPIRGAVGIYGILEIHYEGGDDFVESDVVFLEGLANIISLSVERLKLKKEVKSFNDYSENALNASPDSVKILSREGRVLFVNEAGLCRMQFNRCDNVIGMAWTKLWPENSKSLINDAISRVVAGESVRFESFCPTARGEPRWWDVTAAPILDEQGQVDKIIAVSRDITERHDQEARLACLVDAQNIKLSEAGLRLDETHHRVKNSLHLVNTLLLLQANLAVEDVVKAQLQIAANRVLTIAMVHERLYQDTKPDNDSALHYLKALLSDISKAFGERTIELKVGSLLLPSERIAPLGFIVSELVTNAFKYGSGAIVVNVTADGGDAAITVSDEGNGFPESYPKPNGSGLGMRLVKSYSGYGSQAITIDRTTGLSVIRVRFKISDRLGKLPGQNPKG